MKYGLRLTACLVVLSFGAMAQSEPMPDDMLQKDYDNCMGGNSAEKEPQRAQFCNCVRDGMRSWSVDQYGAQATEAQQSQKATGELADLTKKCLSESLK